MPADGVIALGEEGAARWLHAEVDPARVTDLRRNGAVLNTRHWLDQPGAGQLPPVRVVSLV